MVMVTLGIGAIMFYKKVCYCYALFYAPFNNTQTGARAEETEEAIANSFIGLLLTLISLTMDGITGGLQDKAESQAKKPSTFQVPKVHF